MKPNETADFSPRLLLEVDISKPLSDVRLFHPKTGTKYERAQVLVRIFSSPIGCVFLHCPSGEIDADAFSRMIWDELHQEINSYLQKNNLPEALTPQECEREGFVTLRYTLEQLGQMKLYCPQFIARDKDLIIGYFEQHADADKKQTQQHVPERPNAGFHLQPEFGIAQHHARQESTKGQ